MHNAILNKSIEIYFANGEKVSKIVIGPGARHSSYGKWVSSINNDLLFYHYIKANEHSFYIKPANNKVFKLC